MRALIHDGRRFGASDVLDPLGTDFSFPLQADSRGDLALVGGEENLKQALHTLADTLVGEVILRRAYGSDVPRRVHGAVSQAMAVESAAAFEEAALEHEPRIESIACEGRYSPTDKRLNLVCEVDVLGYRLRWDAVFPRLKGGGQWR